MNKFTYIISLFLLSVLIAGCIHETNATLNTEEITFKTKDINTEKDASAVLTEGKQKKDTVWLKEKSLFQFEAGDGEFKYSIFLFAEDEQKMLYNGEGPEGKKGDTLFTGHYDIYLAEKDSTVAYKQDVLQDLGKLTFNLSGNQAYPLTMGNKTLIAISQKESSVHSKIQLLAIKDGVIKKVKSQREFVTISGTKLKTINQTYLQTAHYDENENLGFSTWAFDESTLTASLHDQSDFGNNGKDDQQALEKFWLGLWSEKDEHYFPYLNLELNKDVIEKAKQGIPIGSPYPIGTNISEIKKTNPHFLEEGVDEKGSYIMYPEITYYFEEITGNVTAVSIPGERMKTTMGEVIHLFGKPAKEGITEKSGMSAIYAADKYMIKVAADKNGKVTCIYLQKKNHAENPA